MKKILVDAYLAKNLGDDLFLYLLFNRYRNEEIKWIVNSFDKKYKLIFNEFKNVEIRIKHRLSKVMFKSKLTRKIIYTNEANEVHGLLLIGGSIFMQDLNWKEHMKRTKERVHIFKNKGRKLFLLGANFGPFKDERFINGYKEIFKSFDDICFRDMYSYNLFKENSKVRVASDIVFKLEGDSVKEKNTLGISLIDISNRDELKIYSKKYKEKIIDIINYSTLCGIKVKLFSFCENQKDLEFCEEIYNETKDFKMIKIISYKGDIKGYLKEFSSVENIIGVRFHSIILSQIFNQGVYPLIYSDKSLNILKDIKLDTHFNRIENIEKLNEQDVLSIISENKISNLEVIRRKAELQFIKLDSFIFRS